MVDDQADVRNWATFGVGHQLDDDGMIIRDALSDRLDDTDYDTRWEAIIGLARRHDPRVLVPLRNALIEGGEIPFFGIVAAGWLADPRLLQPLQALTEQSEEVQEAIGRCDPSLAARRVTAMTYLLETLTTMPERSEQEDQRLDLLSPAGEQRGTHRCDRRHVELGWDVENLLDTGAQEIRPGPPQQSWLTSPLARDTVPAVRTACDLNGGWRYGLRGARCIAVPSSDSPEDGSLNRSG